MKNIIGDHITMARTRKRMSQEKLADIVGVSKAAISRYEAGLREPKLAVLKKIADALDVSIGFLEGYDDMNAHIVYEAARTNDAETLESILGLEPGSVKFDPEKSEKSKAMQEARRAEKQANLAKLNVYFKYMFPDLTQDDVSDIDNLMKPFSKLNAEGRKKAIERVAELLEVPKYQK